MNNRVSSWPMLLGSTGSQVRKLERILKRLGFQPGRIDGVFDRQTLKATKSFERQQRGVYGRDGHITRGEFQALQRADRYAASVAHARAALGINAATLKVRGALAHFMDNHVPNHVNCANFVSACLRKAGLISKRLHDNRVVELMAKLRRNGWQKVSLRDARPGAVVALNSFGHVVLFAGWKNGKPTFIGSNNVNADNSQRVTYRVGAPRNLSQVLQKPLPR